METSNREVVGGHPPAMPPFGVKLYCLATMIGIFALVPTAWGVSPTFGIATAVVGALHLLSIYGLWKSYLIGLDLAIAMNVVNVVGAVRIGSFMGIVLPVAFVLYLRHVRDYYK